MLRLTGLGEGTTEAEARQSLAEHRDASGSHRHETKSCESRSLVSHCSCCAENRLMGESGSKRDPRR